jgi:predicted ATPase
MIRHLGKIERATLDIKPITLLVGENNTNKSWTAYSIYALLKAISSENRTAQNYARVSTKSLAGHIRELASEAARKIEKAPSSATLDFEYSRESILKLIESDIRLTIRRSDLAKILAAPDKYFSNSSVSLIVPKKDLVQGPKFFTLSVKTDGEFVCRYSDTPSPAGFEFDAPSLDERARETGHFRRLTFTQIIKESIPWLKRIETVLLEFILWSLGDVFALPAEREALVTVYKTLSRESAKDFPLPMHDFVITMRTADARARDDGQDFLQQEFVRVASKIKEILGGEITFNVSSAGNQLIFTPGGNVSLPIQAASSMVRSLSGLAVVTKRFEGSRNVLVIDEPEMNAHPSAQLATVELLAALANMGNYVIATTHSPYIVDHINNLIVAGALKGKSRKQVIEKFALSMEESLLSPADVAAYQMSPQGAIEDLVDRANGRISTATFGDVSSRLENLYGDLLEIGQK